jgi:hypothetical protein
MVASLEDNRRKTLSALARTLGRRPFSVIIPILPTVELRYAKEQECEQFIADSCKHGLWAFTLWDSDEDRINQTIRITYYFEDERDAIHFKMRFS